MAIQTVQATVNGLTYNLEYDQTTGKYVAEVVSPAASSYIESGHYFPVSVTATDDHGNSASKDSTDGTFGTNLRLFNKEQVKPVVTITSPTSGSYVTSSTPSFAITLADDANQASGSSGLAAIEDGKNPITVTLDGTDYDYDDLGDIFDSESFVITPITMTGSYVASATVSATFLPLSDGQHTLSIVCYDNDGNASLAASATFTVDTVAPSLVVSTPTDGYKTNQAAWTVSGTTNDVTSAPVTVTVKLDGTDQGTVTVAQDGTFTKTGTYSTTGTHVFTVRATDAAGKYTEITRTVSYSTTIPVFTSISIEPNPVNAGSTYRIYVEVH